MPKCRSCKAEIFWVVTESGKYMPIDYNSEIAYLFDDDQTIEFEPSLGMISHFATCPNANNHRRGDNINQDKN